MTTRVFSPIVLSVLLVAQTSAQGPIRGPMVGWVWDSRQEAIRPILGITGSSVLGKPVDLGVAVKAAAISGRQEYALILAGDERAPYLVDLHGINPSLQRLDGVASGGSTLTMSARGSSVALWYADAKKLVVLTGLSISPSAPREIDLSVEGAPASIAVSDDGGMVLTAYPDIQTVLAIDLDGNRTKLPKDTTVRAMAFLEDSRDALISAGDGLYLAKNIPAVTDFSLLVESSALNAVAPLDARNVLIINGDAESVVQVNVETGETRDVQCPCVPTGLIRMTSGGTFRLNEVSSDPIWLVEITDSGLRTVFVPPDPPDPGTEG